MSYIFPIIGIIYAIGLIIYDISNRLRFVYIIFSLLLVISCFLVGSIRYNHYLNDRDFFDKIEEGANITFQGKLAKKEKKTTSYYLYFNNTIINDLILDENESIILESDSDELPIGSTVIVEGKNKKLNIARNEGNYDEKTYYNSIGVLLKVKGKVVRNCEEGFRINQFLYDFKKDMENVYDNDLPNEEAGVITAMTLGDKSNLDSEVKDLFKLSGLFHILAISGLHISIVGMSIYRFLRKRGVSFLLSGIISSVLVVMYGFLCNGGVSTIRAIGMFLVMIGANILGEGYDVISALSFLALLILVIYPYSLNSMAFVFSFGAVLGIAAIVNPCVNVYDKYCRLRFLEKHIDRAYKPSIKERFTKAIISGVLIQLVTLPIVCFYYYEIPLYVVFLNIIVIPMLGVLIGSGLLGGIIGTIALVSISIIENVLSVISSIFLWFAHIIIYVYEFLAYNSLKLPFARIITGKPSVIEIVIYYVLLVILARYFVYKSRDMESFSDDEIISHRRRLIISVGTLSVLVLLMCNNDNRSDFEMDMIDVGQGDGIYIGGGDINIFVDGGSSDVKNVGTYRILPFLKYKGIRGIDYWFISHVDSDHISGLLEALDSGYRIDNIVVDKYMLGEDNYKDVREKADKNGSEILIMNKGDSVEFDDFKFSCIFAGDDSMDDINANSLVLLGEYGSGDDIISMLLGGDMTVDSEKCILEDKSLVLDKIDILKVSHHGSKTSSSEEFLSRIMPNIAIISAGVKNRYNHPSPEIISRLEEHNIPNLCTKECGRICLVPRDDGSIDVERYIQ